MTVTQLLREAMHNHRKAVMRIRYEGRLPKHLKEPLVATFGLVDDYVYHVLRFVESGGVAAKPERPSSRQPTTPSKTAAAGSSCSSSELPHIS